MADRPPPSPEMVESGRKLRATLEEIPGAVDAMRRVLKDPKTKEELAAGVVAIGRFFQRAREPGVGIYNALAEVDDPAVRRYLAGELTKLAARARAGKMQGAQGT